MRSLYVSMVLALLVSACGGGTEEPGFADDPCSDGIDNDGDGTVDFPDDPGCTSASDTTEDSSASPLCSDGRDNDNDGLTDYPADPGCFAPNQDDETDDCPNGPNCPECANDKDDDGNGSTDYPNDPGCASASDGIEFLTSQVACGAGLVVTQVPTTNTITGMLDGTSVSSVGSPCGGGGGAPARAYQLYLPRPKVVEVSTDDADTTADTVIDIRKNECTMASAEIACNDNVVGTTRKGSKVTVSLPAGNYYIIVSARDSASGGAFALTVKLYAGEGSTCSQDPECGPGLVCRIPKNGTTKSCQQPMCKDGVDDDGDTKNDYPTDPGCSTPDDNDEVDSCPGVGPNCAECGDGTDNDLDTKIDYPMDTTCSAAGDTSESCVTTDGVTLITTGTLNDTLIGANNDVKPTCATTGTHTSPDQTYRLDVPALASLRIQETNMTPSFSAVNALYDANCTGTVQCTFSSTFTRPNVAAGTYFLVVDQYSTGAGGAYTLNVSGVIQNGGSCEGALAQSGAFVCGPGYACKGTTGARTCAPALCGDGVDNDSDGKIDYPADPGCDSIADDTEANPATLPVCADGMDNDTDTLTDWPADYGCSAASGTSEVFCPTESNPTSLITATTTNGTTAGMTNNFPTSTCQSSAASNDITYALSLPVPVATLTLDTDNSGFDTVLTVRDPQCATELACNDDGGTQSLRSKITMTNVAAGNYAVVVDGYSGAGIVSGATVLTVKGVVAPQTACSSPLFTGANAILACPTGTTCTGAPLKCQ